MPRSGRGAGGVAAGSCRWCAGLVVALLAAARGAAGASCFDGAGGFAQEDWPFCHAISPTQLMYYGPTPDGKSVNLGLHVEGVSDAWTALGIGGNGGMKGAHQIVVRKVDDQWVAEDRHSLSFHKPPMDEQQDVRLLFAAEVAGSTSWGVEIPRDSCDEDDYPIGDYSQWVLWAIGSQHEFSYHQTRRGQFHANLITGPKVEPDNSGLKEIELRMPDIPVVAGPGARSAANPYICTIFDLAQVDPSRDWTAKHHVVSFLPHLSNSSKRYTHHIVLYGCPERPGGLGHLDVVPSCEGMPLGCTQVAWAWAVGGRDIVLPEHVGMPFGQKQTWFAMQAHFFNPSLDAGVVDSSGVRLLFADRLRAEDAGIFVFLGGVIPEQQDPLPPRSPDVRIPELFVPGSCTSRWKSDINVLSILYHAHFLGKRLDVAVTRGDQYVGSLRHQRMHDFNFQSFEEGPVRTLKPGDQLNFSCSYNTSEVGEETPFGEGSQKEMCYAAMLYYPLQKTSIALFRRPTKTFPHRMEGWKGCLVPGRGVFRGVSTCAELASRDPMGLNFADATGLHSRRTLAMVCNLGFQSLSPEYVNERLLPGWCPDCFRTRSCSELEATQWAQAVVCPHICGMAGVSVWPDLSRTEIQLPTHAAMCGDVEEFSTPPPWAPPPCVPSSGIQRAGNPSRASNATIRRLRRARREGGLDLDAAGLLQLLTTPEGAEL